MERLCETHRKLDEYFGRNSANEGNGPACRFMIDHELGEQELLSICEMVQGGLRCCPLDSLDWQISYLPLLICAVEVGYEYEGNGTDFWPSLSEKLGYEFGAEDRERISKWFARASSKYGVVTPGESQWELAFRHIAWPITHAVAAKDIRRPFADCLRRFRRDVTNESLRDETIVGDLTEINTPVGSRRFHTWLRQQSIVAGIARDLLGGKLLHEAGLLTRHFRDRLIEDLRNEPEIRQAVLRAGAGRIKGSKASGAGEDGRSNEIRWGEFFLRQDENGGLEICGEMPELPKSVQNALKPIRRRWKVRPWGYAGASPIPSDCLRSTRGHFVVSFSYIARADADKAFFTSVDEQLCDDEARRWLESIRFPASELLAFPPIESEGDSSHCITSRTPHRGKVWVLARRRDIQRRIDERSERNRNSDVIPCRYIGEVEGGEIHEFDAGNMEVREWLGWPAAMARSSQNTNGFVWIKPSPIVINSKNRPVFARDDEIGVSVQGEDPVQLVLQSGNTEIASELVSDVATVSIESNGDYEMVVRRGDRKLDSFLFYIVDEGGDGSIEPDPETPWRAVVTHVDAGETELGRQDLFNRRLVLDIVGDREIENLTAKLSVQPGDATTDVRLDRIPVRLPANHRVWDDLIKQIPTAVLKSPCDLSLTVEVEEQSSDTWRLEAELQELWWEHGDNDVPIAVDDGGRFEVRHYCVVSGRCIDSPSEGDPFISVALDQEGNALHFDARVGVVGNSLLHRQVQSPERYLRQMDDDGDISGLRTITQRYLQLSSASSSSLPAEVHRVGAAQATREWMLHSVCGPNWIYKQREVNHIELAHPVVVWWKCQAKHEDILQPLAEEPRDLPENLPAYLLAEFAEVLPAEWWDGEVAQIEADDAVPLDTVYQHLINDDSVIVDVDALTMSLREANEQLCGAHLADLVIPPDGGDELLAWHVSDMNITDCAAELQRWSREWLQRGRGRRSWTTEELQTWLNLLLYPERLRRAPWETVMEKLLHDRPVARAGAFVAWRLEQNSRLAASASATEIE